MIRAGLITALIVLVIGAAGFRLGYLEAEDDHALVAQTERLRVDKANYDAALAAFRYSEWRDRHYLEMRDSFEKVRKVARSQPAWADTRLPDSVRDAARNAVTARAHPASPASALRRVPKS